MTTSTPIFNGTKHAMKVRVGSARYSSELATVEAGRNYAIGVDYNATYREYIMEIDAPGLEKIIVSSDDLCDNKCITIKEENGKLSAQMEPRRSDTATSDVSSDASEDASSKTIKKTKWIPAWMSK